jgi:AraC-like DNA-binding protein
MLLRARSRKFFETHFVILSLADLRPERRDKMKKTVAAKFRVEDFSEPHLVLCEIVLASGSEWTPQLPGWMVIHVSSGVGYWLHPRMNRELPTGAVVVHSDQVRGSIRASQVGELRLNFFRVEPAKLTGMVTMSDQRLLQSAAGDEKLSLRVVPPNPVFSETLKKLNAAELGNRFPVRAQLLLLFLEVFGGDFEQSRLESRAGFDASVRLRQMLNQMSASELMEMSFSELVSKTGCSARHVSRLFTEMVGVSFREKQVELRLARACELLATTDYKVVDVALESGYQSTSLFNLIFKQRFNISPAKWRDRVQRRKPARESVRRLHAAA